MACSYVNFDDAQSFLHDVESMMDDHQPSLLRTQSQQGDRKASYKSNKSSIMTKSVSELILLERGGVVLYTKLGPIQFGMPPETVKDSINMGLEIPTYYIIPTKRFDKKYGISVAEFEFPAYFNFFVKKRQIALICTAEVEKAIRTVFQETLLGPKDYSSVPEDFYYTFNKSAIPDFTKELSVFSRVNSSIHIKNPSNLSERLTIDHLLRFELIDPVTKTAIIKENDVTLKIVQRDVDFQVIEDGVLLKTIKDVVRFPLEYNDYLSTRKADDRVESLPQIVTPGLRPKDTPTFQMIKQLPEMNFQDKVNQVLNQADPPFQRDTKKKTSILLWNNQQQPLVQSASQIDFEEDNDLTFTPPDFGVTILGCSHGFDPKGSTSGYIFWVHGRGIMVDPPPFASFHMKQMGIPSIMICAVIISHCHADHDAGTFHKILDDTRVEIITTRTIMNSFLRKYSAISGMPAERLKRLFIFRPVIIGTTLNIYGAYFDFFYAMHTIPSLGFSVRLEKKSIYFSSDTFYDPEKLLEYKNQGIISQARYEQLAFPRFNEDIILHEAGVPPIHTPQSVLAALPSKVKNRLYLVHTAEKDLLKDSGLKLAKTGIENTMILIPSNANKTISTIRRLDLLSTIDIFEHLTLKNIRWLLDSLTLEEYKPEQIVVKEGSFGNKFYIIEQGLAKVSSSSRGGEFERYYQVGDYFGESAVIQELGRRGATVQAVTSLRVLTLEKHDFWFIFGDGYGGQGPIISKMKQLTEARKSKAIHTLFKNSVLSELTPSQKTQLEMILTEQEIEKGTILWKVGEEAQFAILVKRGTFEFIDCPEQELEEFDSGAFIGEVKAMCEEGLTTTSIRATRKSVVFKIQRNDLITFLSRNPGLYILFSDYKYID